MRCFCSELEFISIAPCQILHFLAQNLTLGKVDLRERVKKVAATRVAEFRRLEKREKVGLGAISDQFSHRAERCSS